MAQKTLTDPETDDLEKYFTDVERLRGSFSNFLTANKLPKRILVVHGVGGVGKSSLLRMFRLHARNVRVPVALASAEESKSVVDVLSSWAIDLKTGGVTLGGFQKTLVHYKAIQAKVEDQAKKAQEARRKAAEKAGTAVAKAVINTAISLIPGGQIVNVLGEIGVDALVDWLSGFLTKPDIDLLLDPTKALSKDFLEDIAKVARKRRLVLMLDTYEQMSTLNDWVCDISKKLDENVLLVIAGREMVNWDRQWDGWLTHVQVEELEPMTEEHMRELAHRYYATMVGGEPDPKQIKAITTFSRGLPMVVATAVRLWVKYRQKFDIEERKAEVYGDVVKRLREGVSTELLPILEAAAIVRWFDRPILRAITRLDDVDAAYDELRRFPFVKSGREGLRLHDSVREIMGESLRIDDSERYKDLHERAAKYFEKQIEQGILQEKTFILDKQLRSCLIEGLYHRVSADSISGLRLIRMNFDSILRSYDLSLCDEIVGLLETVKKDDSDVRLWSTYMSLQLSQQKSSWENGYKGLKKLLTQTLPPELEIEVRWNLGVTLDYRGERDLAVNELEAALRLIEISRSPSKVNQAKVLTRLGALQGAMVDFESAYRSLAQALECARSTGNERLIIDALNETNYLFQRHGYFEKAKSILYEVVHVASTVLDEREVGLAYARLGELLVTEADYSDETLQNLEKAVLLLEKSNDIQSWSWANRNLGVLFMGRQKPQPALRYFKAAVSGYKKRKATRGLFRTQVALCECYLALNKHQMIENLAQDLEELGKQVALPEWLARWRLIQGHIAWNSNELDRKMVLVSVLDFYKEALINALHFNKILLDDVLGGNQQDKVLRPIIPFCLERGEEGYKILIELREWWKTSTELKAEELVRTSGQDDNNIQKTTLEQFDMAIGKFTNS